MPAAAGFMRHPPANPPIAGGKDDDPPANPSSIDDSCGIDSPENPP
jgi:hypothetical protein